MSFIQLTANSSRKFYILNLCTVGKKGKVVVLGLGVQGGVGELVFEGVSCDQGLHDFLRPIRFRLCYEWVRTENIQGLKVSFSC